MCDGLEVAVLLGSEQYDRDGLLVQLVNREV